MKKFLLTLGIAVFSATFVASSVADEKDVADAELLDELKQYCNEVAEEDKPDGQDLNAFVLKCVNDELESMGYSPIKKI